MSKIKSPCINICGLDKKGVCKGCLRTKEEIAKWLGMDDMEKQKVMERIRYMRGDDLFY